MISCLANIFNSVVINHLLIGFYINVRDGLGCVLVRFNAYVGISTIFQSNDCDQFLFWWRKPEYLDKTDHPFATGKDATE